MCIYVDRVIQMMDGKVEKYYQPVKKLMILWLVVNYERFIMKKNIFGIIVISLLSGAILVSCQAKGVTVQPVTDVAAQTASDSIVAEGKLVPTRSVELAFFPSGGVIEKLNYPEGSLVKMGDVLANLLVTPQQTASVASAELELVNAKNDRLTFLEEAEVQKTQLLMNVALAKDRLKDAASKEKGQGKCLSL